MKDKLTKELEVQSLSCALEMEIRSEELQR